MELEIAVNNGSSYEILSPHQPLVGHLMLSFYPWSLHYRHDDSHQTSAHDFQRHLDGIRSAFGWQA